MNRVILIGNLTRDPELRHIPAGTAVADLGLAVSEKYKTTEGESREEICFVDVVVWNKTAEACASYLGKGSAVLIEGRLKFDQWETDNGEKRSKIRVRADRVHFMSSRTDKGAEPGAQV